MRFLLNLAAGLALYGVIAGGVAVLLYLARAT